MAWSYRKRIKIIPGVHVNISKGGISTSIGVKGASLTFGRNGTYLNSSIPGTGLSNRTKLRGHRFPVPEPNPQLLVEPAENIFSADVQEITSQDMQGIKEAIISAHEQRIDLRADLQKIKSSLGSSKLKLAASYVLLYGLIKRSIPKNIKADIAAKQAALLEVNEQIENCFVDVDLSLDAEIEEKYMALVDAFRKLTGCQKIWDVTSENYQDRVATRSAASTVVRKREVKFGVKSLPDIKTKFEALWLKNANGADLYFYPSFVVMYSTQKSFALVGFDELQMHHHAVRFIETGTVPGDSQVIDRTWAKVNRNGTPDKRFKNNYQIPVVKYGELALHTATGLNEQYQFSHYEHSEEFAAAFRAFQSLVRHLPVKEGAQSLQASSPS